MIGFGDRARDAARASARWGRPLRGGVERGRGEATSGAGSMWSAFTARPHRAADIEAAVEAAAEADVDVDVDVDVYMDVDAR